MVYLAGLLGLFLGFMAGQLLLSRLLRGYSKKEILEMMKNPGKRLKYGLLNWLVAAAGAAAVVSLYMRLEGN